MHHSAQCIYSEWNSKFCVDPEKARDVRCIFLAKHADTETVVLAAHFPSPTAGKVVQENGRFKFALMDDWY